MTSAHRIVPPAVAAWIAAVLLIGVPEAAGAVVAAAIVLTPCCLAVAVSLRARQPRDLVRGAMRTSSWFALGTVVLLFVGLVAVSVAARSPGRSPEPLMDGAASGRPVTVRLLVTDKSTLDDTRTRSLWDRSPSSPQNAGAETAQRIRGTVTVIEVGTTDYGVSVPALLFATVTSKQPVPIGTILDVVATPRETAPGDGAAVLLFAGRPAEIVAQPPWYLAWAAGMRAAFVDAASALPGGGGELLPGLAVGETSGIGPELDQAMKASALSHLTAVSGANCAVIVAVLTRLLALLGASRRARILGALIGLGLFVVLVTPEPSVVRAALMAVSVLVSLGAGRPTAGLPVLSTVVVAVVIADPWLSRSYGFVLSALATAGLLTLTRPLTRTLSRVLPRWIAIALAVPLAAQLACQPVLILLSPSIPLLGVPANLLAAPVAPFATLLGLLACILIPFLGPVAVLALWLGWLPSSWIAAVATTIDALPLPGLQWLPGAAGAAALAALTGVLITGVIALQSGRRIIAAGCAGILVITAGAYTGTVAGARIGPALARPGDWSYAACDVGQGDAVLIRSGGAVALVDTGAEPGLLSDCLDLMGVGHLDLLVLTHFDLDHVGGVDAVTSRASLVLTGEPQNTQDERILADLVAGGAIVRRAVAGDSGDLGTARWRALWPPPRAGHVWEGNAASVTLVVEPADAGGIRSLFLGDLGEQAQDRVLAGHGLRGPVDLVKVAHHGSADQSARLYLAAGARIGLVSVGADNDYGHPTASALEMLAGAGTSPFRTDQCGLVVVGGTSVNPEIWTARRC